MAARWFQLDDFYKTAGDQYIFYPHLFARGYRLSAEQRAAMDEVLGPFLKGRLWYGFLATFLFVTFALTIILASFLFMASTEQLDAIVSTPPWIWLVGAFALACLILAPTLFRLQSKIRRQIEVIGLEASEPPRPGLLIVDGELSLKRLIAVIVALGVILILVASIDTASATSVDF
ncbi:MAG: hypothetical protein HKN28_15045 [Alphaproteobacteria bacterium]|nr:hypothetical protein [Alphaproteobacteria bacterium]